MSPLSARMSTDRYSLGQRQKTVQSSFLSPQGSVVTLLLLLRVPISYQTTLLFCFDSVSECSVWLLPPSSSSPVLYTPTTPSVCVLAKGECVPVRIYLSATPRPHHIADSSATAWNIGLWITWIIKYNYQCLWTSDKTNYNQQLGLTKKCKSETAQEILFKSPYSSQSACPLLSRSVSSGNLNKYTSVSCCCVEWNPPTELQEGSEITVLMTTTATETRAKEEWR